MNAKHRRAALTAAILLAAAFLLTSCTSVSVDPPAGFAEVSKSYNSFKAISPEGLRFSVSLAKNDPFLDLEFWQTAYQRHMTETGYTPYGTPIQLESILGPIHLAEWVVPYGGEPFVYANAIALKGRQIVVAKIGGPEIVYAEYRDRIVEALEGLE